MFMMEDELFRDLAGRETATERPLQKGRRVLQGDVTGLKAGVKDLRGGSKGREEDGCQGQESGVLTHGRSILSEITLSEREGREHGDQVAVALMCYAWRRCDVSKDEYVGDGEGRGERFQRDGQ